MKMRNIVLMGLMALLASAFVAYGVPSFTPVVDGVKDLGWGTVPDHDTNTDKEPLAFNVDSCYVTDDSANVYIGMATDPDPWGDGNSVVFHVMIDIRKSASGGTFDPYTPDSVRYDMSYLPEYEIVGEWSTDDQNMGWVSKCTWQPGTSDWAHEEYNNTPGKVEGGGGQFTEILLARNEFDGLAQEDTINISIWCKPAHWYEGGKPNANSCLPEDTDFPTDWGDCTTPQYFSTQFFYVIQTVLVDEIPPQVVSASQAGPDKVIVEFDEYMDETTLVFGNFTIDGGLSFNASQVLSPTSVLLTANGNFAVQQYTVTADANVKDLAGNSVDPLNNSASFNAILYALITFVYVDQNEDLTDLYCKGSFDNYGNYDPSWGVTPFQMYDDGIGGSDTTASDGRWTAQFYLKPSVSDTFVWGATEGLGGDWAMDCGDIKFQVLDVTPGQVQIYTVGVYAPVTFRIDDSAEGTLTECWLKGTFNSIGRYEGAWSDFLQMYDDGAHDDMDPGDNIWGLVVNLVPDDYCHDSTWEWGAADAYNGTWLIDGPNRQFAVPTSDPRIETYVIVPTTSQAVTVTFNVDCQYLLKVADVDSMAVAGYFNGWDNTANIMSDLDNDSVYTEDVLFDSGSVKYHEFKFVRWYDGTPELEWIDNRVFYIDDSGPTQTVDCIWNDWIPAPPPPDVDELTACTFVSADESEGIMLHWIPVGTPQDTQWYNVYQDTAGIEPDEHIASVSWAVADGDPQLFVGVMSTVDFRAYDATGTNEEPPNIAGIFEFNYPIPPVVQDTVTASAGQGIGYKFVKYEIEPDKYVVVYGPDIFKCDNQYQYLINGHPEQVWYLKDDVAPGHYVFTVNFHNADGTIQRSETVVVTVV